MARGTEGSKAATHTLEDRPTKVPPSMVAPFFKITISSDEHWDVDTNLGDAWKWYALKVAAAIRKDLGI